MKSAWRPMAGFFAVFLITSCSFDDLPVKDNNSGVVLGFDDYHPDTWEQNFDLFDKYNAKVTFFVTLESPSSFCLTAQSRGHEIAYHTIHHPHLPTVTRENFLEETVSRIDVFKSSGIDLTTFAYPFGEYEKWMHDELLQYYKIVRGFSGFRIYNIDDMKHGFIDSKSIDNTRYKTDREFKNNVARMLKLAKLNSDTVISLTSHMIGGDDWGITPERLEYVLRMCQKLNLKFYTYKELQ
jgi:peptidoglycan/xylan/chitin deacetylase (PgdA/CDA1 family)